MLARDKRDLAAFVRQLARAISLIRDKEALLTQAAEIEAEAEQLERLARSS